jgi:hypothetical protein
MIFTGNSRGFIEDSQANNKDVTLPAPVPQAQVSKAKGFPRSAQGFFTPHGRSE